MLIMLKRCAKNNLKYVLLLLFLSIVIFIYFKMPVQNRFNVYLISAYPTNREIFFGSCLYKVDSQANSIQIIKELVKNDKGVSQVQILYDFGFVSILNSLVNESVLSGENVGSSIFLNLNNPSEIKEYTFNIASDNIIYNNYVPLDYSLMADINGVPTKCVLLQPDHMKVLKSIIPNERKVLGVNLFDGTQQEINKTHLKSNLTLCTDSPSFVSNDYRLLIINVKNEVKDTAFEINLEWNIPVQFQNKSNRGYVCVVFYENKKYRLLAISKINSQYLNETTKDSVILVDKNKNDWKVILFDEKVGGKKIFGEWIVGFVQRSGDQKSPGYEIRQEHPNLAGIPLDDFLGGYNAENDEHIYFPGILFINNIIKGNTIKIETNQGDSEILLIEDDVVYYRVYDKIYKADITDDGIENKELLVKDERVPDIHWAFLSEN